ncbi:MAG: hypothetical protein IPJ27_21470 [Candidatus Accumulibacter sp.]|uniref:Uncharacterized protein n=1 Tax=Candidatus Accumulibacter proximus TaxID=2954385 RepID=A0A935Q180_9PROT|nr:hypothetical protein [Candidatus Accumulibacter proximus]
MTLYMTKVRSPESPQSPLSLLLADSHKEMYPHQLVARFPHVAKRIAELWNDAEAIGDYFTDLMIPSRSNRQGFPPEVAVEIMALSMAHDKIGPVRARIENPRPGSGVRPYLWENEPARRGLE